MIQILYIIPIDSSNLDTSLVIDMSNMINGCNELKESDLPLVILLQLLILVICFKDVQNYKY